MPCGKGVCLFANGDFYEGYFNDGAPKGRGRMIVKGTRIDSQSVSWIQAHNYHIENLKVKEGIFKNGDWSKSNIINRKINILRKYNAIILIILKKFEWGLLNMIFKGIYFKNRFL